MAATSPELFIQESIAAYGYDGALELNRSLIRCLFESQQRLPTRRPITELKLLISDSAEQYGGYAAEDESIWLAFSRKADIAKLLPKVPLIVEHEVAHIAHAQNMPRSEMTCWNDYLWQKIIIEGIATHAESLLTGSKTTPPTKSLQKKIDDTLVDVLYGEFPLQDFDYSGYLYSERKFPHRAYDVGHFVIQAYATNTGSDLEQLMTTSMSQYREFAETQL